MPNSEGALAKLCRSTNPMTVAVAQCLAALVDEIVSAPPPEVIVTYVVSFGNERRMAFSREQLQSWTGDNASNEIVKAMGMSARDWQLCAVFFSMPSVQSSGKSPQDPKPIQFDLRAWSSLIPRVKSLEII